MTFANAADGRIAGKLAERVEVVRQEQRAPAHASSGKRRFGTCVAAADDDDLKCFRKIHFKCFVRLFADAKLAEDHPEDVVGSRLAENLAQRVSCESQLFGKELNHTKFPLHL